jgi:peptidoglycan/LPS O-acetylase OafA/YrhL
VGRRPATATADGWSLGHRPGLDHVRGVAVLLVVLGHTIRRWGVGGAGRVGVAIFFVLSGFLITRLLLEERDGGGVSLGRFYLRRARRLLPALVVFLPLAAFVNDDLGLWVRRPVVATLTYTANYDSVRHGLEYGSFTHLWSLAVEEHFYLVWPALVLVLGRRWLVPACLVGIGVVAVARYGVAQHDEAMAFRATHLRIDAMLVGAVLSVVIASVPRPPRVLVLGAVGCLGVACYATFLEDLLEWGFVVVALASAVLVAEALWWPAGRWRWLAHIGVVSYGLYLFHLPVALWLQARDVPELVEPVATLAVSLVIAELSYWLVERPIRHGRGRDRPVAEPAASIGG